MTASDKSSPSPAVSTTGPFRSLSEWIFRLVVVALLATLVELALVIPVFPAAASDLLGMFALFVDVVSLYLVFGAPFAALAAIVEPRLTGRRLPASSALVASVGMALLATSALALLDRAAAHHPAEFPETLPNLVFVARGGVMLVAALGFPFLRKAFDRAFRAMPKLGEPRIVLTSTTVVASVAAIAFVHLVLAPVYLIQLAGGAGLVMLAMGLFAAGLAIRAPRIELLRAGVAAGVLFVGSIPLRFDEHARFVLFGHVPIAGTFAVWLRNAGDFDKDSTGSPWLFGNDCAPRDPRRGPTLIEKPGDGIDQDCRGGDAVQRTVVTSPGAPWPGCRPPERPNVLLITIDAFRADRLQPRVMPFLSEVAGASVAYARAYAPAGMTGASLASLFSGRAMTDLNTVNVLTDATISVATTFPAEFHSANYRTGGANVYPVPPVLTAGLEEFDRMPRDVIDSNVKTRLFAATLTDHTLDFFRRVNDKPALWWVHYPDAHAPYLVSADLDPRTLSPYELGLRHIDQELARLFGELAATGKLQSTIVAITADHGEQLGTRLREGHGPDLFEEEIHVPLLIYVPGCTPRVIEEPVSNQRLGGTLVRLAGLPTNGPTLLPGSEPHDLPIVTEEAPATDVGFKRAVIDGNMKLIVDVRNGGRMLFDLGADPGETQNLARQRPDITARLEDLYQRWLDATGAR